MSTSSSQGDERQAIRDQLSWKIIPFLAVTALLLYALVGHLADAGEFKEALLAAQWQWFAAVLALMAITFILQALRFQIVLKAAGYRLGLIRLIGVLLTVWPFALITPARINDLLRAIKLRRDVPPSTCMGSVVAERFVDVQTLCLIGMVGCLTLQLWTVLTALAAIWIAAWAVVIGAIRNIDRLVSLPLAHRIEDKLRAFLHAFESLREKPGHLGALMAVSAAIWLAAIANLGLLFWIFGVSISWYAIIALWPLALFAGMLPVTVGGMGTRDGAFVALLMWSTEWSGLESALLAATFGYGLALVILPGIIGIPWTLRWLFSTQN